MSKENKSGCGCSTILMVALAAIAWKHCTEDGPSTRGEAPRVQQAPRQQPRPVVSLTTVTVTVHADPTKANGRPWDAFHGLPDIALCWTVGEEMECNPGGHNLESIESPRCRDTLDCVFRGVPVRPGTRFLVVDVDFVVNDFIGEGACAVGGTCRMGQATVRVDGGR